MKTKVHSYQRKLHRKLVKVKAHNRNIKNRISRKERKAFTGLAKLPYEVGGQLDFENGNLGHTKLYFGRGSDVEYEWDPDYEVSFHSHTNVKGASMMPSYDDIIMMKQTKEKEQIIFHKKIALSVFEKDKFDKVGIDRIKKISDLLQKDYEIGMNDVLLYNKYKPVLREELGLEMSWHNPYKRINLESKSI